MYYKIVSFKSVLAVKIILIIGLVLLSYLAIKFGAGIIMVLCLWSMFANYIKSSDECYNNNK